MGYMGVSQTPTYPIVLWLGGGNGIHGRFGTCCGLIPLRGSNPRQATYIGELAEWAYCNRLKIGRGV